MTFTFLSLQLFFQILNSVLDIVKNVNPAADFFYLYTSSILLIFFNQNTALIVNLGRWFLVLYALEDSPLDFILARHKSTRRKMSVALSLNLLFSLAFAGLVLAKIPYGLSAYRIIQALVVHPLLVVAYGLVYRRLRQLGFATKSTIWFILCVIQYLAMQTVHLLTLIWSQKSAN